MHPLAGMAPRQMFRLAVSVLLASFMWQASAWTTCGSCWCANGNATCPTWEPKNYSQGFVTAFKAQHPLNPYAIDCNPYTDASCQTSPPQTLVNDTSAVCGRVYAAGNCSDYRLVTFPTADAARVRGHTMRPSGVFAAGLYMVYLPVVWVWVWMWVFCTRECVVGSCVGCHWSVN